MVFGSAKQYQSMVPLEYRKYNFHMTIKDKIVDFCSHMSGKVFESKIKAISFLEVLNCSNLSLKQNMAKTLLWEQQLIKVFPGMKVAETNNNEDISPFVNWKC